jgi:hypothetical protein
VLPTPERLLLVPSQDGGKRKDQGLRIGLQNLPPHAHRPGPDLPRQIYRAPVREIGFYSGAESRRRRLERAIGITTGKSHKCYGGHRAHMSVWYDDE